MATPRYDTLALILGDMLFPTHKALQPTKQTLFFMAEDVGLCTHFRYHKHKLILFLSAMRSHADGIAKKHDVVYHKLGHKSFLQNLEATIKEHKIKCITTYEIEDKFFEKEIIAFCKKFKIKLEITPSPKFLTTKEEWNNYRSKVKTLRMQHFYTYQRKRLNILVKDGKPEGGKWSYDQENRKPLPKTYQPPQIKKPTPTKHAKDVAKLIEKKFKSHPGSTDNFWIPTTRKQAITWMDQFFKTRFKDFGPYEDAIHNAQTFLLHSQLSPLLNCGLITPQEVVDRALKEKAPLQSKEGFIRQIIGWREFIRGVYQTEKLEGNFFKHKRKLSSKWYNATTGILPIDDAIEKVQNNAYLHHIERLMVISNFMLLSEIDPKEVYKWFMELFCDSADWVMVPNVYGMGQFADGGVFATKPYISGSAYILKMSNYKRGEWCDIWDALYWRFINKNRAFFLKNPRLAMMVRVYDKMDENKRKKLQNTATKYLKQQKT